MNSYPVKICNLNLETVGDLFKYFNTEPELF